MHKIKVSGHSTSAGAPPSSRAAHAARHALRQGGCGRGRRPAALGARERPRAAAQQRGRRRGRQSSLWRRPRRRAGAPRRRGARAAAPPGGRGRRRRRGGRAALAAAAPRRGGRRRAGTLLQGPRRGTRWKGYLAPLLRAAVLRAPSHPPTGVACGAAARNNAASARNPPQSCIWGARALLHARSLAKSTLLPPPPPPPRAGGARGAPSAACILGF